MSYTYHVRYKLTAFDLEHGIDVVARNKQDAYDRAVYEKILEVEDTLPYSAWVSSVTYNNGNYRMFDTFEGKPY